MSTDDPPANPDIPNDGRASSATALQHWFGRAAKPHIVYPVLAILVLTVIWGTTLSLIRDERTAAEHTAALSTHHMAEIYEAQVVRALREIDATLKVVKYADYVWGTKDVLQKLKARTLLPPALLFNISIVNSKGDIVASTNHAAGANVADRKVFQNQRQADVFSISRPRRDPASGTWKLDFSRRLDAPNGGFAGIAMLSVDAAYFVSSYESSQLGQHGLLGLLGMDGVFLARRSGDTVSAGGQTDFSSVIMHRLSSEEETTNKMAREAMVTTNPWDGVQRYTMAHELYGYPLAVIVGLSEDEQLADVRHERRVYLWRASAASLLALLVITILFRMSQQLVLSRQRIIEEHVANAAHAEYLAYHDGLTTLPNRSLFSKLLDQSIRQAHRYNRKLAVLFFDLDHFKEINDTLGHEAGDQLLQEIATRLKACLRASDTIARMGGDEFVALLPELQEEKYVVIVAEKILAAVARPFILHGQECFVTASIGISIYPRDGLDEQTLERKADIAMYQVKEKGRNNFRFYSEI